MAEQEFKVKVVGVDYICDECKDGKMEVSGSMIIKSPDEYKIPHKCNKCNHEQLFLEKYPTIRHLRVN